MRADSVFEQRKCNDCNSSLKSDSSHLYFTHFSRLEENSVCYFCFYFIIKSKSLKCSSPSIFTINSLSHSHLIFFNKYQACFISGMQSLEFTSNITSCVSVINTLVLWVKKSLLDSAQNNMDKKQIAFLNESLSANLLKFQSLQSKQFFLMPSFFTNKTGIKQL